MSDPRPLHVLLDSRAKRVACGLKTERGVVRVLAKFARERTTSGAPFNLCPECEAVLAAIEHAEAEEA